MKQAAGRISALPPRKEYLMLKPRTDTEFLEALLEAEIHPGHVLEIVDTWLNGTHEDAVALLNPDPVDESNPQS